MGGVQEWDDSMNLQCFATRIDRFEDLDVAKRSCAGNGNCVGIYDFNCLGQEFWTCGHPMNHPSQSCGHQISHVGENVVGPDKEMKKRIKKCKKSKNQKKCEKNKFRCKWVDDGCVPDGDRRRMVTS